MRFAKWISFLFFSKQKLERLFLDRSSLFVLYANSGLSRAHSMLVKCKILTRFKLQLANTRRVNAPYWRSSPGLRYLTARHSGRRPAAAWSIRSPLSPSSLPSTTLPAHSLPPFLPRSLAPPPPFSNVASTPETHFSSGLRTFLKSTRRNECCDERDVDLRAALLTGNEDAFSPFFSSFSPFFSSFSSFSLLLLGPPPPSLCVADANAAVNALVRVDWDYR